MNSPFQKRLQNEKSPQKGPEKNGPSDEMKMKARASSHFLASKFDSKDRNDSENNKGNSLREKMKVCVPICCKQKGSGSDDNEHEDQNLEEVILKIK